MKRFIGIMAAIVFVLAVFVTPSMAQHCCGGSGLSGLEIAGGSGVGAQIYTGGAISATSHNNCFSNSRTLTAQRFVGVGVSSGANGSVCLSTQGNARGGVYGVGQFDAGIEGSIMGADYYTNSSVTVCGYGH